MKTLLTAVVVALIASGSTAAATTWINGWRIKPNSIPANRLTDKARASLRGQIGPAGPAGPQGPQGPQGVAGANGEDGAGILATRLATKDECPNGGIAVLFSWPYIPPYANNNDPNSFYWHICNGSPG